MQNLLCPACNGWQLHPVDRICGNCSEILIKAEAIIKPSTVYQNAKPTIIQLFISKKYGCLEGTTFLWRRQRDGKEIAITEIEFSQTSENDDVIDVEFPFNQLSESAEQQDKWELIHKIMDGCEPVLGGLSIGKELPELEMQETDIILSTAEEAEQNIILQLRNIKGGDFDISELTITASDGTTVNDLPTINGELIGITLHQGETLDIPLNLSVALVRQLHEMPVGQLFKLTAHNVDLPTNDLSIANYCDFRLRIPKPAFPVICVSNNKIKALENGRIYLPVIIENRGGESCTIMSFDLEVIGNNLESPFESNIKIDNPIRLDFDGNNQYEQLLRLSIENTGLTAGKYLLNITINAEGIEPTKKEQFELYIEEPQPYTDGIVVIDFGTTASAAAYYEYTGSPTIIPLADNRKLNYIPTAIAYYLNSDNELKCCIGEKAEQKLHQLPAERICFLDNLKWRMDKKEPILLPDTSLKQWWQVIADYLKAVKQRIEDHPDIMAIVDTVCITQPSRFNPQLSSLLYNAYQQAGMEPMILYSDRLPIKAVSESWSPSMLSLRVTEMLSWQRNYMGSKWQPDNAKYLWLNFDMGGGSTDLSLMALDIDGYDQMRLIEIASGGDNDIAGNFISSLIYKHISFVEKTDVDDPQELNLGDYPIILPWDNLVNMANDRKVAIKNGHSIFDQIIFPIQRYGNGEQEGILQEALIILLNENKAVLHDLSQLWLDDSFWSSIKNDDMWMKKLKNKGLEGVLNNYFEKVKHNVTENPEFQLSVSLKNIHGAKLTIASDQIRFDITSFIKDFIVELSLNLYKKINSLFSKVADDEYKDYKVLLLQTGRGAQFPLIKEILQSYISALPHENKLYKRILGDNTKTIIAEGACHIGHQLTMGQDFDGVSFEALPQPTFGFLKGKDKTTGHYYFQELFNGIVEPNDGWVGSPYPVHPGLHNLSITFTQNLENEEIFTPKEDNFYVIRGRVNFPSEQAKNTHLLIRMLENGKLEAWLGVQPDEQAQDYEQWEKQQLGSYQLLSDIRIPAIEA